MKSRLLACCLTAAAACAAPDIAWPRYPLAAAPKAATEPVIDGVVDRREWFRSVHLHGLVDTETGQLPLARSAVFITWSATHFYLAFQFERPPQNLQPTAEDYLELHLDSNHDQQTIAAFAVNIDGPLWSARGADVLDHDWQPEWQAAARGTESGWEGELRIPFAALDWARAPGPDIVWGLNVLRVERTPRRRRLAWSYVGRFPPGYRNYGRLQFLELPVAVSILNVGWFSMHQRAGITIATTNFSDAPVSVTSDLALRRAADRQLMHFLPAIDDALTDDLGQPRGDLTAEVAAAISRLAPVAAEQTTVAIPAHQRRLTKLAGDSDPGDYLATYHVALAGRTLAAAAVPYSLPSPLQLQLIGHLLLSQAIEFKVPLAGVADQLAADSTLVAECFAAGTTRVALKIYDRLPQRELIHDVFRVEASPGSSFRVAVTLRRNDLVAATAEAHISCPEAQHIPDWRQLNEGRSPAVPPPWTPVEVVDKTVNVLGRSYRFAEQPVPAAVTTFGHEILAAPMTFIAGQPWSEQQLALSEHDDEAAVFTSRQVAGNLVMDATTRVEFDGFMLIDLNLTGTGQTSSLTLEIPLRREDARLLQNYYNAPGPGEQTPRYWDVLTDDGYVSPPKFTTWIGTDDHGLEWSCESSRGWAMADPDRAMVVAVTDQRATLSVHLISKPVDLDPARPRHIRFALVATPTKTLMPYLRQARFYDDVFPCLLPMDWSGDPGVWHPPVTEPAVIDKVRTWVGNQRELGVKLLVNGGWNVSAETAGWPVWGHELCADPLRNVSFSGHQQYAACYHSPYSSYLVNSFGYNARQLGFAGIRFDTVIPGYVCKSLVHDCGWYDDDGNLWGRYGIFAAREAWKRLYRIFHGGVIDDGCIQTPNAAGPIMAVHSFADHHEIGESFYQKAPDIKTGYPPGLIRSVMTGAPYGLRAEANIKSGPLFWNQRIAALLVNGAEPRFLDYRHWKPGYEPQASPAINIWEAWEWVDRWTADYHPWWQNAAQLELAAGDRMVYGTFWLQNKAADGPRLLLVVSNYETEPIPDLLVHLDLPSLGIDTPLFAEDAVTFEPVPITGSGDLTLCILGQRYRLLRLSAQPPRYLAALGSPNLLTDAPELVHGGWRSAEVPLEPGTQYILTAELHIDSPLGVDSKSPNVMGRFSPSIRHHAGIYLESQGVRGVLGIGKRALISGEDGPVAYRDTDFYRRAMWPQYWETTPGWMPLFLPLETGDNVTVGRYRASVNGGDNDKVQFRNLALRRVPAE